MASAFLVLAVVLAQSQHRHETQVRWKPTGPAYNDPAHFRDEG